MKKYIFNDEKLVIASHNTGKVKEISAMLNPLKVEVLSANDFNLKEPVEDGSTFEENALIKSSYVSKNTGIASLSDDSGICFCVILTMSQVFIPLDGQEKKKTLM